MNKIIGFIICIVIGSIVMADEIKQKSELYEYSENDLILPYVPDSCEERFAAAIIIAQDLTSARMSGIRQVTKKIGGEMRVYFEICGSGYSLAERHAIEKEIQEAIKQILNKHFDK